MENYVPEIISGLEFNAFYTMNTVEDAVSIAVFIVIYSTMICCSLLKSDHSCLKRHVFKIANFIYTKL